MNKDFTVKSFSNTSELLIFNGSELKCGFCNKILIKINKKFESSKVNFIEIINIKCPFCGLITYFQQKEKK